MALSPPAKRELIHNRRVQCSGYRREDGLFDIEGEISDAKTYAFPSRTHGEVGADQPYHHMRARLTINSEMQVLAAEAETLAGPYPICPQGADNITGLVGLTIGPGWRRRVQKAIGGPAGCTHISELMGPVATTAYQTLYGEQARRNRAEGRSSNPDNMTAMRNSCLAYADGGAVAREFWEKPENRQES